MLHETKRSWLLTLPTLFALTFGSACNQVEDLGEGGDGDAATGNQPGGDGDGKDQGDGGTAMVPDRPIQMPPDFVALTDQQVCDRLLECADSKWPSQFGDFFPVYGTNGSCWASQTAAQCRQGCIDALKGLEDVGVCNYCDTPTSCMNSSFGPSCEPRGHQCVDCNVDSDCKNPYPDWERYVPVCQYNECVQCREDSDCLKFSDECLYEQPFCYGITCQHSRFTTDVTAKVRVTGLAALPAPMVMPPDGNYSVEVSLGNWDAPCDTGSTGTSEGGSDRQHSYVNGADVVEFTSENRIGQDLSIVATLTYYPPDGAAPGWVNKRAETKVQAKPGDTVQVDFKLSDFVDIPPEERR